MGDVSLSNTLFRRDAGAFSPDVQVHGSGALIRTDSRTSKKR